MYFLLWFVQDEVMLFVNKQSHAGVRLRPGTLGNLHTRNCQEDSAPPEDKPILFEAGISHRYLNCFASVWVSVLPNKWSSIRLSVLCHLWRWQTKKSVYPRQNVYSLQNQLNAHLLNCSNNVHPQTMHTRTQHETICLNTPLQQMMAISCLHSHWESI